MNILIINAHSSQNKGDAGIILAMLDSFNKHIPNASIKIKTRFPDIDRLFYENVSVEESVANISVDPKDSKLSKVFSARKLLKLLSGSDKRIDPDYEWADVVVSCGGGFLLSHRFSTALLQHLVQIKIAFDYKKPVIIYAQSIGPFYNSYMQKLSKKILDKVDQIYIRETISKEWLNTIGCTNENVHVVPDAAFSLEPKPSGLVDEILTKAKENHKGPIIGLTARDWNFPEMEDKDFRRRSYVESIQEVIKHVEKKYQAKVLLMPQVLGPNPFNDDRLISKEILQDEGITTSGLLDVDFSPRELKYLYSQVDLFIGTRMHSNIFALSSFVPTIAINYEHKTRGIMEMLDLEENVVEINEITPADLIAKVDHCWANKEAVRKKLEQNIPNLVKSSEKPAIYIKEEI